MGRHRCTGDETCGFCRRAIDAAEDERDFPETNDAMGDGAAADMVFGRWDA